MYSAQLSNHSHGLSFSLSLSLSLLSLSSLVSRVIMLVSTFCMRILICHNAYMCMCMCMYLRKVIVCVCTQFVVRVVIVCVYACIALGLFLILSSHLRIGRLNKLVCGCVRVRICMHMYVWMYMFIA